MTNTKFRKRALLSSVAMLLVALIALGSATFAWFAANPDATAKGLELRTTASSGLVIKTDTDSVWSHNALLGVASGANITGTGAQRTASEFINANLKPASEDQDDATKFYSVEAANAAQPGADTTKDVGTLTPSGTADGPIYTENVYFRLSDGSKAESNATITLTGVTIDDAAGANELKSAIRVAVVNNSTGALVGTYGLSTPSNKTLHRLSTATGYKYPTAEQTTDFEKKDFTNGAAGTGPVTAQTVYTGALSTATSNNPYATVYIYLDGEDQQCFSDNVSEADAAKLIDSIQLDFHLAVA